MKQIKRYRPGRKPRRIVLKTKSPPSMERPADGEMPGAKDTAVTANIQIVPATHLIPFRPRSKPRQVVRKPKSPPKTTPPADGRVIAKGSKATAEGGAANAKAQTSLENWGEKI